ncbi:hypothetical protein [Martelella mediterranea]|uniref:Uncharacterized protein n=1 Tax=Martelella mediterranea TaxID=293089 RepID=A0A4R3NQW3_9HYPH|nr:hypothetical protein [Martelella mediterranea]TCT37664.1 hypothetical protein EDC90_101754 [Martelella mediterranea]
MTKTSLSYFDKLPKWCIPGLQAAYDNIASGHFSDAAVFRSLTKEFEGIGEKPPTREVFYAWVKGIAAGDVKRPGGADEAAAAVRSGKNNRPRQAEKERGEAPHPIPTPSADPFVTEEGRLPPLTPLYSNVETDVAASLKNVREQLIRDTANALSRDIQKTAEQIVDTQLRALMAPEGGAA